MSIRWLSALGIIIIVAGHGQSAEPAGKILKETWEAVFLEGNQVGHAHGLYREMQKGDQKVTEASTELEMTLVRNGQTLQLQFTMADHEAPDGKVLGLIVQQSAGKGQVIVHKGKVEGNQLVLKTEIGDKQVERKVDWSDKVVGLYAKEKLFEGRELTPNSKFDYLEFNPAFVTLTETHVTIKDYEETSLLKGRKTRLLRIETRIDPIMKAKMPPEIAWLDDKGEVRKRKFVMPGLGELIFYRTTKEQALTRNYSVASKDVGISQMIRLQTALARPGAAREVTYRIRLKGVDEPATAIAIDDRQKIRSVKGDVLEVVVRGLQQPTGKPGQQAEKPPEEYLQSNHFLRSDNASVKLFAKDAVGRETDPWRKAVRIERWVQQQLRNKNYTEAFATADQVAKTLEGDCSEHSVLAAAMCRAVGVPSRTAVGLVYVPQQQAMGYHMWIEVWIDGKWYALDPTLGQGRVAASHVKISDHHWNDVVSFTPLLPLLRVIGQLEIEVLSARYESEQR